MKGFDLLTYGFLIVLVAFLGWKVYDLRSANAELRLRVQALTEEAGSTSVERFTSNDRRADRKLPAFALPYLKAATSSGRDEFTFPERVESESEYYLFVFFTPIDCYACFADVPFWTELRQGFAADMQVIGITTSSSAERSQYFVKKQEIDIPVLYDEERRLFNVLTDIGYPVTPLTLLTNKEGVILHVEGSKYGVSGVQAEYKGLLRSMLPAETK